MEYILDAGQMKEVDDKSINVAGIPSMVLMERAALAVRDAVLKDIGGQDIAAFKVLCVCGTGNNGADGLAAARQLSCEGLAVTVLDLGIGEDGVTQKNGTAEYAAQKKILDYFDVEIRNSVHLYEYDYIVDAIFGIGLSRQVEGRYKEIIESINEAREASNIRVVAVDIPSGVNAGSAEIEGVAVKADITVTFGYKKMGMMLYPGREYCGQCEVVDIGFVRMESVSVYTYTQEDLFSIPKRNEKINKGGCGKALIIAGSKNIAGAACMSAAAAYRSGCGMVKVFTHENNRGVLTNHVPEALCYSYSPEISESELRTALKKDTEWSDTVILGPGLSTDALAGRIVKYTLENLLNKENNSVAVLIIDADALNIIASDIQLKELVRAVAQTDIEVVITPHIVEMSRILGKSVDKIKQNPVKCAKQAADKLGVICVLKDAVTIVCERDSHDMSGYKVYINNSGNAGMATAGSGDVLTGVIAGMVNAGFTEIFKAVTMGVYVHGLAGDFAREKYSQIGMKAMDEADMLPEVFKLIGR